MLPKGSNLDRIMSSMEATLNAREAADQSAEATDAFPFFVSSTLWKNVTALVPKDHRLSTDARLERFILHHIRLDGARALRYLMRHPDQTFSAHFLWQALAGLHSNPQQHSYPAGEQPPITDTKPSGSKYHAYDDSENDASLIETSIPITDEHCLREISRELGRLLRQREAALYLGLDVTPLDGEIQALRRYLNYACYPDGRPRNFPGINRRATQSMSLSLKRFRERVAALDPELAAYIESHLDTNPLYIWHSGEKGRGNSDQ